MDTLTPQQAEEQQIQAAFQQLLDTYLASNHRKKSELITKAFNFAKSAHHGVRRRSGEPYILHPIAVAQVISGEMGLGSTSICAALLHDVVEDTDYTREDIANLFGPKIANIVEGVTKVSSGLLSDAASSQAETFKKILLTMSDDIRVILVKMADRLHNMRTLSSMLPSKQHKIVGETLYIFAPLADRLGLNRIKTELEDLSFRYEHPDDYEMVIERLRQSKIERDDAFADFTPAIRHALDAMGIHYDIKARIKSPYSIWQKMQRKKIPFEEVFDILAIRIVFRPSSRSEEISEAYRIYGALTQIYKPHPSRLRDWLSTPKANGYQALQNTFMSSQGRWIEVQIRSERMDDIAEGGVAAHWKYKDGSTDQASELDTWVNSIKEILDDPQPDTLDLLDTIKLNLFASELNVFTPKGEIVTLPQGATVLDFAFSIHTMIGSHCIGAKVNHRLVPLSHPLSNGDQIEVLTSQSQTIKAEWQGYVTTGKAKGKISAYLRRMAREEQQQGERFLHQWLAQHDLPSNSSTIQKLRDRLHYSSTAALFHALATGRQELTSTDVEHLRGKRRKQQSWLRFVPFLKSRSTASLPNTPLSKESMRSLLANFNKKEVLQLTPELLAHSTLCPVCRPLAGDEIVGFITPTQALEIHRRDCPEALRYKTHHGNNIIAARWESSHEDTQLYDTTFYLEGVDSPGTLRALSDVFLLLPHCHLRSIQLTAHDGMFSGTLLVSLHSSQQAQQLCQQLMSIEQVTKAVRTNER
ncbi:MAG: RelA/SpoT family protein [Bacteroidales bacterium]|nr:RelA/SpoT family protein [Bacteroidales bacterium]